MARHPTGQVLEREGKRGRTFALRFRAYGRREFVTLNVATRAEAEAELANALADVRRGIWRAPGPATVTEERPAPNFHEFASGWLEARRLEGLAARTIEADKWALTCHLLPHFASHRLPQITIEEVDRYRLAKVAEREQRLVERPLSNGSVNATLECLAMVLDSAIEYGYASEPNPARGKRRRLKAERPRRAFLEAFQVRALLDAAGPHRAFLATAIMAGGLRVSELCALRWRDVNLGSGRLVVPRSKTEAGERTVDISPDLLDELKTYRHQSRFAGQDDLVFPTSRGTINNRSNVLRRILRPAIERANDQLARDGLGLIPDAVTMHSLRHTYASLLAEAGADPAYVMAQIGHRNARFTLEVYTHVQNRKKNATVALDALIRGETPAPLGTSAQSTAPTASAEAPTADSETSAVAAVSEGWS